MTMSDRGVHPDLVEDEAPAAAAATEASPPSTAGKRRGGESAAVSQTPPAADEQQSSEPEEQVPPEQPEWLSQAREAFDKDPSEAFKLLAKNLPRDQLERDEVISGLIGARSDLRAKEILRQQERDAKERAKLEAAQNNDLYTLGELTQREYQERQQAQQAAQASGQFMDGVVLFQQQLPESLQKQVSGRTFGEGKGQAAGVAEYLQYLVEEGTKLGVEQELRRRESALRKSVLSEVNGDQPVPEREGGTPGRVREVTDEQIAAMSLQEYDALFDENGHPKPGVRHRPTRSTPLIPR